MVTGWTDTKRRTMKHAYCTAPKDAILDWWLLAAESRDAAVARAEAAEARIAELTAVVRSMVDDAIQTHYSGNVACVWCGNAASDSDTQINIHIHDEYCPVWQGINAIAPAAEQQEGGEGE